MATNSRFQDLQPQSKPTSPQLPARPATRTLDLRGIHEATATKPSEHLLNLSRSTSSTARTTAPISSRRSGFYETMPLEYRPPMTNYWGTDADDELTERDWTDKVEAFEGRAKVFMARQRRHMRSYWRRFRWQVLGVWVAVRQWAPWRVMAVAVVLIAFAVGATFMLLRTITNGTTPAAQSPHSTTQTTSGDAGDSNAATPPGTTTNGGVGGGLPAASTSATTPATSTGSTGSSTNGVGGGTATPAAGAPATSTPTTGGGSGGGTTTPTTPTTPSDSGGSVLDPILNPLDPVTQPLDPILNPVTNTVDTLTDPLINDAFEPSRFNVLDIFDLV